jgi:hypothetical protein
VQQAASKSAETLAFEIYEGEKEGRVCHW